jgi:chromosome segregation ATPase
MTKDNMKKGMGTTLSKDEREKQAALKSAAEKVLRVEENLEKHYQEIKKRKQVKKSLRKIKVHEKEENAREKHRTAAIMEMQEKWREEEKQKDEEESAAREKYDAEHDIEKARESLVKKEKAVEEKEQEILELSLRIDKQKLHIARMVFGLSSLERGTREHHHTTSRLAHEYRHLDELNHSLNESGFALKEAIHDRNRSREALSAALKKRTACDHTASVEKKHIPMMTAAANSGKSPTLILSKNISENSESSPSMTPANPDENFSHKKKL